MDALCHRIEWKRLGRFRLLNTILLLQNFKDAINAGLNGFES